MAWLRVLAPVERLAHIQNMFGKLTEECTDVSFLDDFPRGKHLEISVATPWTRVLSVYGNGFFSLVPSLFC